MIIQAIGLMAAFASQAAPLTTAKMCGRLHSPDNDLIAVVTVGGPGISEDVLSAKVCDQSYRCSAVASAPKDSTVSLAWSSSDELLVIVGASAPTQGEDRFPDRTHLPKVTVVTEGSASNSAIGGMDVLKASMSTCSTPSPIG